MALIAPPSLSLSLYHSFSKGTMEEVPFFNGKRDFRLVILLLALEEESQIKYVTGSLINSTCHC